MIAYGYGRISTGEDQQVYSPAAQEHQCIEAWKADRMALKLPWGGFFFDPEMSGGTRLCDRNAGREINLRLSKGDHVFISKADRAFRSLLDQLATYENWKARGVVMHFLNVPCDPSTPEGELLLNNLGVYAQYERRIIGRRIKEGFAQKRRQGLPLGRCAPIGWQIDGKKRDAIYTPFSEERKLCRDIHELRQTKNAFWTAVQLNKEKRPLLARHKLRKKNLAGWKGEWSIHWIELARKAYMLNFPCDQIETRQKWLREAGLMRTTTAS